MNSISSDLRGQGVALHPSRKPSHRDTDGMGRGMEEKSGWGKDKGMGPTHPA